MGSALDNGCRRFQRDLQLHLSPLSRALLMHDVSLLAEIRSLLARSYRSAAHCGTPLSLLPALSSQRLQRTIDDGVSAIGILASRCCARTHYRGQAQAL